MSYRLLFVPLVIALTSCASTPSTPSSTSVNSKALSAQSLAPGECGLFVWSAGVDKQFTLFSRSKTNTGVWYGPDGETALNLTGRSGATTDGQYPKQDFAEAGLSLVLKGPEVITQGTRYKQGILKQQSPEGGYKVTPVVGLSMCQS